MAGSTIKELEVYFTTGPDNSSLIGRLAEHNHSIFFEYHSDWIKQGLELSPFTLPLKPGLAEHRDREFGRLFGLFDDSLPDGWGMILMDRYFQKVGLNTAAISPLDRLAYLGDCTMGALTYHPPTNQKNSKATNLNLHKLAKQSREIYSGQPVDILPQLFKAGGSPGGARPKVLIGRNPITHEIISGEGDIPNGFEHWIVKFSAREDKIDAGPTEYAYYMMACASGIEMPEAHLFETAQNDLFFGVKRFDRGSNNTRHHIHTFGNLIHANFRYPSCDYADLFKATTILTKNQEDTVRLFRLMVFNVLAHNRDDHAKNFSYILNTSTGQWSLSPAYDLTFSTGPGGEHTTTIAGEGLLPKKQHILNMANQFDIPKAQAIHIIDEVSTSIANWSKFAADAGVTTKTTQQIAKQITTNFK